jgi:hypothetical protein
VKLREREEGLALIGKQKGEGELALALELLGKNQK